MKNQTQCQGIAIVDILQTSNVLYGSQNLKKWIFNRKDSKYQRPKFVHAVERGKHPNKKPLDLMANLIDIHTNEGDLVVDCFAGSGSTLCAAKKTNRQFIGIEKEKEFFDMCIENIQKV